MLVTVILVGAGLKLIDWALKRRWKDNPDAQFRFQLIMLGLTFAGIMMKVVKDTAFRAAGTHQLHLVAS